VRDGGSAAEKRARLVHSLNGTDRSSLILVKLPEGQRLDEVDLDVDRGYLQRPALLHFEVDVADRPR
jgi:hypothetical protein